MMIVNVRGSENRSGTECHCETQCAVTMMSYPADLTGAEPEARPSIVFCRSFFTDISQ